MATAGGRRALPIFDLTRQLYAMREYDLDILLAPLVNGQFWVRSAEEEAFLENEVVRKFNESREDDGWGLVHWLVREGKEYQLQNVLSLGVDPDLPTDDHGRPSHICDDSVDFAIIIAACRPDLTAEGCDLSLTPFEDAQRVANNTEYDEHMRKKHADVASIWKKSMTEGPPSIARLAFEEKWWAVQNLVRRKVVPESEMFQIFEGKDAIGWARHYGITGMAEELEYYFIQRGDGSATAGDPSNELMPFTSQLLVTMGKMAMQEQANRKTVEILRKDLTRQTSLVKQLTNELTTTKERARSSDLEAQRELKKKDFLIASLTAKLDAQIKENKKRKAPDSDEQSGGGSARLVQIIPSEQPGVGNRARAADAAEKSKARRRT